MRVTRRWLTCGTIVAALEMGWHAAPHALTSALGLAQPFQAPAPARGGSSVAGLQETKVEACTFYY